VHQVRGDDVTDAAEGAEGVDVGVRERHGGVQEHAAGGEGEGRRAAAELEAEEGAGDLEDGEAVGEGAEQVILGLES